MKILYEKKMLIQFNSLISFMFKVILCSFVVFGFITLGFIMLVGSFPYGAFILYFLVLLFVLMSFVFFIFKFKPSSLFVLDADGKKIAAIASTIEAPIVITDQAGYIIEANECYKKKYDFESSKNLVFFLNGYVDNEAIFYRLKNLALNNKPAKELLTCKNNTKKDCLLIVKSCDYNNLHYLVWHFTNIAHSDKTFAALNTPIQSAVAKDSAIVEKSLPLLEEGLFFSYFKESPSALAVLDMNAHLQQYNKNFAQLFALKDNQRQEISLKDIVRVQDQQLLQEIESDLKTNKPFSSFIETYSGKDETRQMRLYFHKIFDAQRQQNLLAPNLLAIITATEITEQKSLEDKMVHGQKMQAVGQLAGGIAHDFNNVLTAILMSCDLLLASHRSSDPAHADLMNIKHNANRAAALVQQLLAFSRRQTLQPEIIDLTDLLSDMRNLLLPLLGSPIILKFAHGRDLWPVEVDQASFQRVLMNLVINARDAMPKGGNITITTNNFTQEQGIELNHLDLKAGDYVELSVKDTGTGIAKSVQEKMFEPFFTTKEVGKGTGLGLSMVYGIIKQSNGYVYCESEEGKGTVFRIFLPRYKAEKAMESSSESKKIQIDKNINNNADLSGSATVLLVEDEDAVRMGGVRALQSRGYHVFEASNGIEALDILEEEQGKIDIIVSDVVMPEMDGPTLLSELRKKYKNIKFIFVSGYAEDAFAKNLPDDAVFGFLSKPFTLKQLALKVKETLEQ